MSASSPIVVLVWPASTEIGREVVRSLRMQRQVSLVLIENTRGPTTSHVGGIRCLNYTELIGTGWEEALALICQQFRVDVIYPCHDVAQLKLSHATVALPPVVGSSRETVQHLRDKRHTYISIQHALARHHFKVHTPTAGYNGSPDAEEYPRFIKPICGQGSRGVYKRVESAAHLDAVLLYEWDNDGPKPLVTEYLPGKEYTVDCFSNANELLWACPRERIATRAGISTLTHRATGMLDAYPYAAQLRAIFHLRGAWFFQIKERLDGTPVVMEVAPRIAGGSALALANNVNLPYLSVLDAFGVEDLTIHDTEQFTKLSRPLACELLPAYDWDTLVIDIDDTLVRAGDDYPGGDANVPMLSLILHSIAAGRPVYLVTRNGYQMAVLDPELYAMIKDLPIYRVDPVAPNAKIDVIRSLHQQGCHAHRMVFVDDSFQERLRVSQAFPEMKVMDPAGAAMLVQGNY